jgi:hypothetical protein
MSISPALLSSASVEWPTPPDRDEAERFLSALDPGADAFTFETRDDSGREDRSLATVHGSLDEHWAELCRLNEAGAGIYVRVNAPDRVRAVFVDMGGAPMPLEFRFQPQIVVEAAPYRFNLYWIVDGCPVERFAEAQQRLVSLFNQSPGDCDLARAMRVPGFFSYPKSQPWAGRLGHAPAIGVGPARGAPFRVRIVEVHGDASELCPCPTCSSQD